MVHIQEDGDHEAPRGVSSLLNRFEAMARGTGQQEAKDPPRRPSAAHLKLPLGEPQPATAPYRRNRALSTPTSPASPRPAYFDGAQLVETSPESIRLIRPSPSQPELSAPEHQHPPGSRSAASSVDGSPPVTPSGEPLPLRTPSPAGSTRPLVPPRPIPIPSPRAVASPTANGTTSPAQHRRAPPPPVPRRLAKSSSTAQTDFDALIEQAVASSAATSPIEARAAVLPQRILSASPAPSPALPPRSRRGSADLLSAHGMSASPEVSLEPMAFPRGGGSRAASPFAPSQPPPTPENISKLPPPAVPPRPFSLPMPAAPIDGSSAPPALPPRRPTLPSPVASRAPLPVPAGRSTLLRPTSAGSLSARRASEADTLNMPAISSSMLTSMSDSGPLPPPPARNIGLNERLPPVRPASSASGAAHSESSDDEDETNSAPTRSLIDDLPDATYASRRAPELNPPRAIYSKSSVNTVAVHGNTVVSGGTHHVRVYDCFSGEQTFGLALAGEPKITALMFRPSCGKGASGTADDGRYVWAGCKDGQLCEIDLVERCTVEMRPTAHSAPILGIYRVGTSMVTLDEGGKLLVWNGTEGRPPTLAQANLRTQRIDKAPFAVLLNDQLWTGAHQARSGAAAGASRAPLVRVYAPSATDTPFALMSRPLAPPDTAGPVGAVTAASTLQSLAGKVFIGHESGHVSIWSSETFACLDVLRISNYQVTALCGVGSLLWAGYRTGTIYVYDVQERPWKVVKAWKAHKDAVTTIFVDESSLWSTASLHVISVGIDQQVHFWDGFLRTDWFAMQLAKRDAEFCSYRPIRIAMCTWNVDAAKPAELAADIVGTDFLPEFLSTVDSPDVVVFGFQELVDLEDKKLTAKSLLLGRKRAESKLSDALTGQYRLWHDKLVQAVRLAMPVDCPYGLVHVESLVGLFSCVFVRHTERPRLRDVAITTIKTGMGGRYGNKGAIVARFVIDDSSLCFVNCHLAAGQSHKRQRNKDLIEILEAKAPFSDVPASTNSEAWVGGGDGSMVFDHSLLFLSGDLNYRIDQRRENVIRQVGEGDVTPLLESDQLLKEMRTNTAFRLRSFNEARIDFAPTYKYDRHSTSYDTSEKARAPAWCDRILYRAPNPDAVRVLHYRRHEVRVSDHRPVSAGFEARIRQVDAHQRAIVEQHVAVKWSEHEASLLDKAKKYYGPR